MAEPIVVVGAVIVRDGLVLCARRGPGAAAGLWEFPGGKVEPGEDPRAALVREIAEELACAIQVGDELTTTRHEAGAAPVVLTTYWAVLVAGEPEPVEHVGLVWLPPDRLHDLDWAPADLPTVDLLQGKH